jgi:hypothetical protein
MILGLSTALLRRKGSRSTLYDGLIAFWSLSEASGNRAQSAPATTAGDLVPSGGAVGTAAGKLYAAAADWPAAKTGAGCLALSRANFGGIGSSVGAEVSRTIAFWLYPYDGPTVAGQYTEIWRRGSPQWGDGGERIRLNELHRIWAYWGDGAGHTSPACHGPMAVLDTWELWICQQDAGANEVKVYKEAAGGEEFFETQPWSYGQFNTTSADLYVSPPDSNGNATHRLGPLYVWSRILTAAERAALYNAGAGWTP